METIEDKIRQIVGPEYFLRNPVYQSNSWWLAYKKYREIEFDFFSGKYGSKCIVFKDCRIIQKKTTGSRKYEFIELEPCNYITLISNIAQKWVCFYNDRFEIRTMGEEKSIVKLTYDKVVDSSMLAAFYSKPFRNGKLKYTFSEEDFRQAIINIF